MSAAPSTRVSVGFVLATLFNFGILISSKGLGPDLGAVDPLFAPAGCVGILLWGLAYLALARSYPVAPAVALVFFLEKAFYAGHWAWFLAARGAELAALEATDPVSASFFSSYGAGDALFMVFFGWVAWKWRKNLLGVPSRTTP